jgi:cysteine desulfurase
VALTDERGIYLDNNATTPVDPQVVEVVAEALARDFGNPASLHRFGEAARERLEAARVSVARLLGARSSAEVLFTSGGTESIHTALHSALAARERGTVLTSATEHAAVLRPLDRWRERGSSVETVAVLPTGRIDVEHLLGRIDELAGELALVTLHWANNETGALLEGAEIERIAAAAHEHGTLVHLDAVQCPGKVPIDVEHLGVDLASLSGHKFHGPKGTGALYVRTAAAGRFQPLFIGGAQEGDRRAGTANVPGIVGLARAAELAREHVDDAAARARVRGLRDHLERELTRRIPGTRVQASGAPRLDNTASVTFPEVDGELFLMTLAADGVAVSSGAACSSEKRGPSHVLLAMGLSPEEAGRTLRFSLSRLTTADEVDAAVERTERAFGELSALGPLGPAAGEPEQKCR